MAENFLWESLKGDRKVKETCQRVLFCFVFFFQLGVTNSEAHPGGYYHLVKDACTHRY